jgi:hypothetical protein
LVLADGKYTILAYLPKNLTDALTDPVNGPIGGIGELLHAFVIINASFHTCLHVPHITGSSPPPASTSIPQRMRSEPDLCLLIKEIQYEASVSCRVGTPRPIGLCEDILKYMRFGKHDSFEDAVSISTLYKIFPRLSVMDQWLTQHLFYPIESGTQFLLGKPWKAHDFVIGTEQLKQMGGSSSQLRKVMNQGGGSTVGGSTGGCTVINTQISFPGSKSSPIIEDINNFKHQRIHPELSIEVAIIDQSESELSRFSRSKVMKRNNKSRASILKKVSLSGSEVDNTSSFEVSLGGDDSWRNYDAAQMAQIRDLEVDNVVKAAESLVGKEKSRKRKSADIDVQHDLLMALIPDALSLSQ